MYQTLAKIGKKFFSDAIIFKVGFNISPMYRRSTGRIINVTKDLLKAEVKIRLSYKNRNYVGTIYGGSLFSATDPIYMIQLINILGKEYVVWDKSAEIKFKRPAKKTAYATFEFTEEEIEGIKKQIADQKEIELIKNLNIISEEGDVYCELSKTIYIADKRYFKEKRKTKKLQNESKN
ncbi:MAG: DUF4442 domain-containing protein [Flavobacteriaceae bacterium]